ncbi:hypothetical protein AAZX31_11G001000 [Glycine max]|uniref:DM2 domain-containing protein n=3 Tax=Glycine subgen. Soja TaxID=1462606 RepID=C6SYE2_SOYBN|nr:uncharacterized protein LOC100306198 [Glycine max]XP_028186733.1 upstream activation factor subunit UAF30-like [Glycine soja]ACU14265.1 unknown [Glycine max]KAG4972722.1 hypothetical protein JHK87_029543 [Glycine soja]KAG4987288.1 hypothetical protein JHK85_030271 [Glycine max]KAG4992919.1 hypothetical protein JHK86_029746 [Glycine max]KAG5122926.1 hypothetical protein JHK82_029663 [Glycine max]|eukprot:NP_001235290.1 uncharacterized protein LOC100306198 [Glycine max]
MALSFGFGLLSSSSSSSSLCVLPPSETHTFMMRPSASSGLRMMRTSRITCCTLSQSSKPARKIRGIMKPRKVSPEMEDLVGAPEMARTQVLKRIWAYIKDNNLQDPTDKRTINCDEKLKKVFAGKDQVEMLEIARLISPHFLKSESES